MADTSFTYLCQILKVMQTGEYTSFSLYFLLKARLVQWLERRLKYKSRRFDSSTETYTSMC